MHGGHYYAFLRPKLDKWFKFDDSIVSNSDEPKAIEQNYGGEKIITYSTAGFSKYTSRYQKEANAYMLIYVRETDTELLSQEVNPDCIHLKVKQDYEEMAERKKSERETKKQKLTMSSIKLITSTDLKSIDPSNIEVFDTKFQIEIKNDASHEDQYHAIEEAVKMPLSKLRLWKLETKRYSSRRPCVLIDTKKDRNQEKTNISSFFFSLFQLTKPKTNKHTYIPTKPTISLPTTEIELRLLRLFSFCGDFRTRN